MNKKDRIEQLISRQLDSLKKQADLCGRILGLLSNLDEEAYLETELTDDIELSDILDPNVKLSKKGDFVDIYEVDQHTVPLVPLSTIVDNEDADEDAKALDLDNAKCKVCGEKLSDKNFIAISDFVYDLTADEGVKARIVDSAEISFATAVHQDCFSMFLGSLEASVNVFKRRAENSGE